MLEEWYKKTQVVPYQCLVPADLEFLRSLHEMASRFPTIKRTQFPLAMWDLNIGQLAIIL